MSIKYYHLAKDEELPDEFCAVSDVGGEPSEYTFYVPESEVVKLRELVVALYHIHFGTEEESWDALEDFCPCSICEERHGGEAPCAYTAEDLADECCEPITKEIVIDRMRELGVEP